MRGSFQVLISHLDDAPLEAFASPGELVGPAFRELREREIPVVLSSSKTFDETVALQRSLGISDPFIVENGGAVYFRKGYFAATDVPCVARGDYQRVSLGIPYGEVTLFLALIKKLVSGEIVGFSDMSEAELVAATGLSRAAAHRAMQREFDEPFKIGKHPKTVLERIDRTLRGSGFCVTRGRTFYHLLGGSDPGRAVALVRRLYQECYGLVSLAGFGSSATDLPMLEQVDRPTILAKPEGGHDGKLRKCLPGARRTEGAGPEGWEEAVTAMLEDWDQRHEN
jgi:mannosyl-3-phosphoglycerate phosphatase